METASHGISFAKNVSAVPLQTYYDIDFANPNTKRIREGAVHVALGATIRWN